MSGYITGYGPKNVIARAHEPKVNLSFASKLPKADLKDPVGMKAYLSVLTQVLPAISPPAAVIAQGFDFVSTDEDKKSFKKLIQQKHIHETLEMEFIELTASHEEPVTFGESSLGKTSSI